MNKENAKKLAQIIKKNPDKQYTVREIAGKLNISRPTANDLLSVFKIVYASCGKTLDFRNEDQRKFANNKNYKPPTVPSKTSKKKTSNTVPVAC